MSSPVHWRCFHCGEEFTLEQRRWAAQHFGSTPDASPACLMRLPGEYHLLEYVRRAEQELAAYRAEDTDLHRAVHAMAAEHAVALRAAEEAGYARGLRDARTEPA